MKKNRLDRREFLKLEAAAMAAAAGGMPTPLAAQNLVTDRSFTELRWNTRPPADFAGPDAALWSQPKTAALSQPTEIPRPRSIAGLTASKDIFSQR